MNKKDDWPFKKVDQVIKLPRFQSLKHKDIIQHFFNEIPPNQKLYIATFRNDDKIILRTINTGANITTIKHNAKDITVIVHLGEGDPYEEKIGPNDVISDELLNKIQYNYERLGK